MSNARPSGASTSSGALTSEEVRRRLEEEPDFVHLRRFDYSLDKVVERYPEGCPTRLIAQALLLTEDDVEILYSRLVIKLRASMGVK